MEKYFIEKRNELGKYLLDNNCSYSDLEPLLYRDIRNYLLNNNSNIYELPTKELLSVLKGIILEYFNVLEHNSVKIEPVVIEVGAGIGLLTYLLMNQPELNHIKFIATDPFTSHDTGNIDYLQTDIEKLDLKETLDKYSKLKPLIIWSWIPLYFNATDIITQYPIDGIIYIGEYKLSCGTNEMFEHTNFDTNNYCPLTLSQCDTFKVRFHSCISVLTKKELKFGYKHDNLSDIAKNEPYNPTLDELIDDIKRNENLDHSYDCILS